jgi:serine/threonine protein kinase
MFANTGTCENQLASAKQSTLDELLDGRYQVISKLGSGGFGETYIARDTRRPGHPKCVVKRLKPLLMAEFDSLEDIRRLFSKEAETLEALGHHDRIPQLLAHFEKDQEFYLVQEYIEGHPLSVELTSLDAAKPAEGAALSKIGGDRWSEAQVIQLLVEVLNILKFVHDHNIIHRDIKPENIIRRQRDNRLVLIDFGAVKQLQSKLIKPFAPTNESGQSDLTVAINSQGYTPIEQIRGRPCLNSDIYALGMISIQALTGLHPGSFEENLHVEEILWTQKTQVSAELAAILTTMTRYSWKDRYQTVSEVLQELQPLVQPDQGNHTDLTAVENCSQASPLSIGVAYTPTQVSLPPQQTEPAASRPITQLFPADSPSKPNRHQRETNLSLEAATSANPAKTEHTIVRQRLRDLQGLITPKRISFLLGLILILLGTTIFISFMARLGRSSQDLRPIELSEVEDELLLGTFTGHSSPVEAIAFNSDRETLVSASTDRAIKVWDLELEQSVQTFSDGSDESPAIAVSSDGQMLASSSMGNTVKVWNLKTGELLHTLRGHSWAVSSIVISPDGETLVSGSEDNTLKIWDLKTGELLNSLTGYASPVHSMDISPDGRLLVGGSEDNTIKVWELHTGKLLNNFRGHSAKVNAVAITPNGSTLISGSADNTIKVWNLHSGQLTRTLTEHFAEVHTVAISPDNQTFASGSADNTIKLWNIHADESLYTFRGHTGEVRSVAVSPDGQTLASGSRDRTIKIWQIPGAY